MPRGFAPKVALLASSRDGRKKDASLVATTGSVLATAFSVFFVDVAILVI